MARPKLYPYKITVRLSEEGGAGLERTAGIMELDPAVAARIILEHSVKGEPIKLKKGAGDVRKKENKSGA